MHDANTLIEIFNQLFSVNENTVLVRGDGEPEYLPADDGCANHRIFFAHGFFASALHEVSHWCIAGKQRRLQVDYGYWYEPDGRSLDQQVLFASVEARPQALEWVFAKACGLKFVVSLDNLNATPENSLPFKEAIIAQLEHIKQQGLPVRAQLFFQALATHFGRPLDLDDYTFTLDELS